MSEVATQDLVEVCAGHLPHSDRGRIDLILAAALSRARRKASNPHIVHLFDRLRGFLLEGGKRIRPRLALASYRITGKSGDPPPKPVWMAAASLELFHGFMIVHDDLIDNSVTRRGRPALHEAIRLDEAASERAEDRSKHLALIAGDLLCALGMRMIARSGLPGPHLSAAHRLASEMLFETGLGEGLDVLFERTPIEALDEAHLVEAYVLKTSRYSVSGPLILGATLAGAGAEAIRSIGRFGDLIGLGYQIQNDLDAAAIDPSEENPDLDAGKRTFLLWETHRGLGGPGRRALSEALAMAAGPDRRRRLLHLIDAAEAIPKSRARLDAIRREAADVLKLSGLDAEARRSYLGVADSLSGRSAGHESASRVGTA